MPLQQVKIVKLRQFELENDVTIKVDDSNPTDLNKQNLLLNCSIAVSLKRLADLFTNPTFTLNLQEKKEQET